jgi:prophage regulatory protein
MSAGIEDGLPPLCTLRHMLPVLPIAKSTVWLWVKQGRFPKPTKFGSITLWRRGEVLDWLKNAGGSP